MTQTGSTGIEPCSSAITEVVVASACLLAHGSFAVFDDRARASLQTTGIPQLRRYLLVVMRICPLAANRSFTVMNAQSDELEVKLNCGSHV